MASISRGGDRRSSPLYSCHPRQRPASLLLRSNSNPNHQFSFRPPPSSTASRQRIPHFTTVGDQNPLSPQQRRLWPPQKRLRRLQHPRLLVKFVESAGVRVIPIISNEPQEKTLEDNL